MGNYILLSDEVIARLQTGKCVEGSIRMNLHTGEVSFRAYNRLPHKCKDRLISYLEHGWIKESKQRYKFYNSVRKNIGVTKVSVVMHRELATAMEEVKMDRMMDIL